MNIIQQPWRIVLIPRPLSPAVALAYFILSRASFGNGSLLGVHHVRWSDLREKHLIETGVTPFTSLSAIVDLNVSERDLEVIIERIVFSPFSPYSKFQAKRIKNFFLFGGRKSKYAWEKWVAFMGQLSFHSNPELALTAASNAIERLFLERRDPASMGDELIAGIRSPFMTVGISDRRVVPMPVTKRNNDEPDVLRRREVIDYTSKTVSEGNIFQLMGDQCTVLVGGSAGVGKSTLATALHTEFENNIESVGSRCGEPWPRLSISHSYVSLDAATPVGDAVLESTGQDKTVMDQRKRPWSNELAEEVVCKMKLAAQTSNLIVADLPGKVTDITRLIAVRANYGIILAKGENWTNDIAEWKEYFREIGVPVIAQIKSTPAPSMMVTFWSGRGLSGRLNTPDRLIKGWDPFVRTCAEFLLFDILPAHLERLHGRIEKAASGIEV